MSVSEITAELRSSGLTGDICIGPGRTNGSGEWSDIQCRFGPANNRVYVEAKTLGELRRKVKTI